MKKLSPNLKFGCPVCQMKDLELNMEDFDFKLSEQPIANKVTTLNKKQPKKDPKVTSLF